MSESTLIITSPDPAVRNRSIDQLCREITTARLLAEASSLEQFWRSSDNLYQRVRAQFFLYAMHRFHLPYRPEVNLSGIIPYEVTSHLLKRRFEEAIHVLLDEQSRCGPNAALSSAFAAAYRGLAFKTLAGQVRHSVRSVRGNQWMSRIGHPDDYPLKIRPELASRSSGSATYPILRESTPVRMDLTHSAWSDIFFLGMDYPEGARVLNVSIDLSVRGQGDTRPKPPVEAYFRVIDEPVLRLTSVDLGATADLTTFSDVFDFARDYLGLLKAAVIASGIIAPAMEGAVQPLSSLLVRLVGDSRGIELVSRVRDIPKGSRLAVSTNLLSSLIAVCMRATGQAGALAGPLNEADRRLVAARAILGEWLGGSGGGWQDSGGVWPGIKLIQGVEACEGDPEFGISRGRLLPAHHVFSKDQINEHARTRLQDSLVLVHGGMAQDVGPILEMVTEKYLLRAEAEWVARNEAGRILDEILDDLKEGNIRGIGAATERNFFGPIQNIIPWASNLYTESLIGEVRDAINSDFWGFWMLGGMAGGGMGFMFSPAAKAKAQEQLQTIMRDTKRRLETAVPFAMDPVIYDFAINENGTCCELLTDQQALMPEGYYGLMVPALLRMDPVLMPLSRRAELDCFSNACRTVPEYSGMVQNLFDRLLPSSEREQAQQPRLLSQMLQENGFDPIAHEQIKSDLRSGRIGLAQNRMPASSKIEDVRPDDLFDARRAGAQEFYDHGVQALEQGAVAVVTMAGGAGTRWTRGAGVVKALNPFCKLGGAYRNFIEVHQAKTRHSARQCGTEIPHVITTSYLTHEPIQRFICQENASRGSSPVMLSPGRSIGLRLVPMTRDLRFAWEELTQQLLDEQKEKVRDSVRAALIQWAERAGEGSDYTDNVAVQCLHPTGHWYELPNLLRNGVLLELIRSRPQLRHLMVHNIDTVGVSLDPVLLGYHVSRGAALTFEVITRHIDDRGGGLARVDSRVRLVEGLALPSEELESLLSYYNSNTFWVDIDKLLVAFQLTREELENAKKVTTAVRTLANRMPTYVTLKDVKKRWGKGQEDVFSVAQFEKLFVDMTSLPELDCAFAVVPRERGNQLKEPAQLDAWLRDGSAAYVESLCDWN
ncbi:MAG: UTP--glucose-1-phosphate uridylyltransferase [Acidobacteriaceae bacterium]|nr:UTP--glucose-1-phosphate uridylyltransferase [Acidobacteriaceae bacterium]